MNYGVVVNQSGNGLNQFRDGLCPWFHHAWKRLDLSKNNQLELRPESISERQV